MWLAPILLVLILVFGAVVRLIGIDWDLDQHLHPDERFLTMVESSLTLPGQLDVTGPPPSGCAKWGGFFDTACSPLNPYNHDFGLFVYGTFPIFITRIVGGWLDQTGYGQIFLVGRALSALFDLSTVLLIFFIGRRLYDTRVGLLGALFLAASVLDIQQSHFFTVDTFTNVPILIAFWYAMDIADGKKWTAFLFAGCAFGIALAGRINIAPFVTVILAAAALRAYLAAEASRRAYESQAASLAPAGEPAPPPASAGELVVLDRPRSSIAAWLPKPGTRAFAGLVGAGIATLLLFRIAQPYAANGPNFFSPRLPELDMSHGLIGVFFDSALSWAGGVNPKFADNMTYISGLVSGKIDYPPGDQWTDRTAYIFPFDNMVRWGLGPPMGLAAWAGFLLALYELVRYRKWNQFLVVVWVGITFGYSGQQFVKTMRYFLQIYPFLALLAGYFLVALWDRVTRPDPMAQAWRTGASFTRLLPRAAVGLLTLVVVGYTLFWATAFTTIYTRPVSRVAASEWMYDNIPAGSAIGNEHWDDPLPLRIDGKDPYGGMYHGLASSSDGVMHWYDEDTPEKRTQAIAWLDEADYLVLSSNRLYASIPRLPMRYPMTTKYYEWLFDGKLGFDLVATFTSRPQLFGIQIADDNAEEAFTVYDHPKVLIFKKTASYSHANTASLFDSVDLTEVYRFTPLQATQVKTALLLKPGDWIAQMSGGTWSQIFDPGNWINQIPVVGWLGLVELLGWIAFPLAFVVFRALRDRGYVFAKAFGILLPAWIAWMMASYHVLPFSRRSIALAIGLVAVLAVVIVWRSWRDMSRFLRQQGRALLFEELLFLLCFGGFLLVRYGNPDLWHPYYGGEKPMDFTLLNEITRSTWFPPYDAWFAGGYLNYYYFGQMMTATLVRFSGIVTEVAYNLALPMYYALTATGAFSVAFNLASSIRGGRSGAAPAQDAPDGAVHDANPWNYAAGLLAALFVAVIGNLGQVVLIGQTLVKTGGGDPNGPLPASLAAAIAGVERVVIDHQPLQAAIGWWYWNASRVIPDTINEFPIFTFLYADLHAHLMALPFTLVVLGLAVNFVVRDRDDDGRLPFLPHLPVSPADVIEVVVAALALGALRAINYADYATYQLVVAAALAVGEYGRRRRIDLPGLVGFAWRLVVIFLLSSLLWQPFVSNFATAYLSVELWQGARTTLTQYLVVYGIFLFVIATYLLRQTFDSKVSRGPFRFFRLAIVRSKRLDRVLTLQRVFSVPPTPYEDLAAAIILVGMVLEGVVLVAQLFVFALMLPFLVLAGLLVLRPDLEPARRLIALLIAAAIALTLVVELIVYQGDIGRMNTVFKFYLQVWVIFGVTGAAGLAAIMKSVAAGRPADVAAALPAKRLAAPS
ncbi:MAG: DUF2298 domain-containing protein, partial [Chloroflexi bacterium]|nr:DUF2298 domain-containing protein [Chloroflexota bacterium]